MILTELSALFLDSRRRGVSGARCKCTPATMNIYTANMLLFTRWLASGPGVLDYRELKRLHISQFLDVIDAKVADGTWQKASALQVLRTLKTFFKWVDVDEECQENGLKGLQRYLPAITKNPPRADIPSIKDVKFFKNSFNLKDKWEFRDYVATCLLLDTGIRIGEACNLRVDHVLLDQRLAVVTGKTGARPVPLSSHMVPIMKAWLKKRLTYPKAKDSPFVFVSKRAGKMTAVAFGHGFNKHSTAIGLTSPMSAHRIRHVFATNFLTKGGDIEKLRIVLGHKTYDMVQNYLHLAKIGSAEMQEQFRKVSLLND